MSELKTNKISTNDQNNVAIDNALGLKSYDTAGRDALTSVAGDMIYNTTTNKPQFYNGSAWADFGPAVATISYLVIAGAGGGGTSYGGGGGAGGYRNSYASETSGANSSTETPITIFADGTSTYVVTVGGGGSVETSGNDSVFSSITSIGGGAGETIANGVDGGSGGGGSGTNTGGSGTSNQGLAGAGGQDAGGGTASGGGGGGAGAAGTAAPSTTVGGAGGNGLSSSIDTSATTRAGGGGGGAGNSGTGGAGGTGGGGAGGGNSSTGTAGTTNTGSGGGGGSRFGAGAAGGSGIVILRWATADATIGATRTGLTDGGVQTDGSDSYIVFTAGTGTISFS
jgi:hypothetical protein